MDASRAKIDAALEGADSLPTGSGKSSADRPETHDINARPARGRAGSDTATAIAVAVPVPTVHPTTWRKSAPRRAPVIPCECCATVWAFKRAHGLTPLQAYKRQHWPMLAAAEEGRMDDYHRLAKERAEIEKVRRDALAYCIECRNPLLATEHGFQFCPYERGRQHEKLIAALRKAELVPIRGRQGAIPKPFVSPDGARFRVRI